LVSAATGVASTLPTTTMAQLLLFLPKVNTVMFACFFGFVKRSLIDINNGSVRADCSRKVEGALKKRKRRAMVTHPLVEHSKLVSERYKIRMQVPKLTLSKRMQL
jgi:hypothetical protein